MRLAMRRVTRQSGFSAPRAVLWLVLSCARMYVPHIGHASGPSTFTTNAT